MLNDQNKIKKFLLQVIFFGGDEFDCVLGIIFWANTLVIIVSIINIISKIN